MEYRMLETRRRSVTKSLIWRFIGIVWTWVGAYLIILWTPERFQNAAWIAMFIVIYHHSTRMVMYYAYERFWSRVRWGRTDQGADIPPPMTRRAKLFWIGGTLIVVAVLFYLILFISPFMKSK
jgi:hypothetical protein